MPLKINLRREMPLRILRFMWQHYYRVNEGQARFWVKMHVGSDHSKNSEISEPEDTNSQKK